MGALNSSLILLFETLAGLYLLAVLLRFQLQIARADFYNPVTQAVVKITDPTVRLFRSFIPGYRGIDFSCLVLALILEAVAICILAVLYGYGIPPVGSVVTMAVVGVLMFIIRIYYYAIIGSIIMSFVMMFSGNMNPHPILQLIWQLTEPIMGPVRSVVPPMGGLDFSPIFIFIGIQLLQNLIITGFGVTVGQAQLIIGV